MSGKVASRPRQRLRAVPRQPRAIVGAWLHWRLCALRTRRLGFRYRWTGDRGRSEYPKRQDSVRDMSMETHVFFRGRLPGRAALSRAMKELGFPFSITGATGSLEQQSGFMPMKFRGEETGVELDVFADHTAVEEFADVGVDLSFERRASFRWGGDFQEAVAGLCSAAALARLVDGVVFDEAENRLLTVDDAIEVARKNLDALPKPPKARSPRGPTVLKRMLAPLLAKRSDLALVGHHLLLIRPVRHLIRGAEFRWHHGGRVCSACPYLRPLYQPNELFLENAAFSGAIHGADFAPMLFDRLAAEVFPVLGAIATIEDFLEASWGKRLWPENLFPSILLSRGVARAREHVIRLEAGREKGLAEAKARQASARGEETAFRRYETKAAEEALARARTLRELLDRGTDAAFAFYREMEAAVAKGYKIEQIWEPSPFPAELPASKRAAKSADPVFPPTPWLVFPQTWRQDPPRKPGEIRYGIDWWDRQDRMSLLHPITREQAEARHRNFQPYTLATRLPEGQLMILTYESSLRDGAWQPPVRYVLRIYGRRRRYMIVDFQEDCVDPGVLKMHSIKIQGPRAWESYLSFRDSEKSIHDYRMKKKSYECRPMTAQDRSVYTFTPPIFGEFDQLLQAISTYLSNEGFGALM